MVRFKWLIHITVKYSRIKIVLVILILLECIVLYIKIYFQNVKVKNEQLFLCTIHLIYSEEITYTFLEENEKK